MYAPYAVILERMPPDHRGKIDVSGATIRQIRSWRWLDFGGFSVLIGTHIARTLMPLTYLHPANYHCRLLV